MTMQMATELDLAADSIDPTIRDHTRDFIRLALVSEYLSHDDEDELRAYFRTIGTSACWGASATASMIYRLRYLWNADQECRPCETCGGSVAAKRNGTGYVGGEPGLNPALLALLRHIESEAKDLPGHAGDRVCRDCEGRGVLRTGTKADDEQTARPHGSGRDGGSGGVTMGETELALLGKVSGRLRSVREWQGPRQADRALEAFLSDGGNHWGAVWPYTPSGRSMLKKNKGKLPPEKYFENEVFDQSRHPREGRAAQFKLADDQARELVRLGCRLYNQAGVRGHR